MSPDDPLFCDRMILSTRLTGDRKAWARLVDEEFLGIDAFGGQGDKAYRLAEFDRVIYRRLELAEHRLVQAGPEAVIILGRARADGIQAGQPFAGSFRYSNVWIRRPEGWKLLASQATSIRD